MPQYQIWYRVRHHPEWGRRWGLGLTVQTESGQIYQCGQTFALRLPALEAARACKRRWPKYDFQVKDAANDKVVWQSSDGTYEEEGITEMDGTPDISEPIKLDRTKLIGRLNEIHAEEKKTREDAQKKEDDARKEVQDFVMANADRVAEFFKNRSGSGGSWKGVLENLTDYEFKGDNYKPKDSTPTRRESDSEKFVRVLEMSNDDTVALTPDQELYELL